MRAHLLPGVQSSVAGDVRTKKLVTSVLSEVGRLSPQPAVAASDASSIDFVVIASKKSHANLLDSRSHDPAKQGRATQRAKTWP